MRGNCDCGHDWISHGEMPGRCATMGCKCQGWQQAASALARKRWAGLTKEQRREATRAATAASPRTKRRAPKEPGSPES